MLKGRWPSKLPSMHVWATCSAFLKAMAQGGGGGGACAKAAADSLTRRERDEDRKARERERKRKRREEQREAAVANGTHRRPGRPRKAGRICKNPCI